MYLETSPSFPNTSYIITPELIPFGPNGGLASFWYHMYGSAVTNLTVDACVGTVCAEVMRIEGQQHSSMTAPWTYTSVNLPPGTDVVRWGGYKASSGITYQGDMAVDTIQIGPRSGVATPPPTASPTVAAPVANFACTFNDVANANDGCGMTFTNLWGVDSGGGAGQVRTHPVPPRSAPPPILPWDQCSPQTVLKLTASCLAFRSAHSRSSTFRGRAQLRRR